MEEMNKAMHLAFLASDSDEIKLILITVHKLYMENLAVSEAIIRGMKQDIDSLTDDNPIVH